MDKKKFILAGPSAVLPGTILDNVRVLKDLVSEVGITFFDSRACLGYTRKDLPFELNDMGLKYHVHLPLDLQWDRGAGHVFQVVCMLVKKAGFLGPDKFVLHPPDSPRHLKEFAVLWGKQGFDPAKLLLENIKGHDLSGLWEIVDGEGLGICLDVGHILAYDQHDILDRDMVWERTSLVHLYGREDHAGHVGLSYLSRQGEQVMEQILSGVSDGTTVLLEVFSLQDFLDSRDILFQMADSRGLEFV